MKQVLQMDNIGTELVQDALEDSFHVGVGVGIFKTADHVIVDDFVTRQTKVRPAAERILWSTVVHFGEEEMHAVALGKLPRKIETVQFRAGRVPREKVVDHLQDTHLLAPRVTQLCPL
jgi:hypothetical protein